MSLSLLWGTAVDQVRFALDNRSTTKLSDDKIKEWLVQSLNHICSPSVHMHPGLFSTVDTVLLAATNQYQLAGSRMIYVVLGVRNTDATYGYALEPKNRRWFRHRVQDILGRPSYYMHISDMGTLPNPVYNLLQIYPTPSTEYVGDTIQTEVYYRPSTGAADIGDLAMAPIEDIWDEAWVLGAIWRGWRDLNQPVFADRALVDYGAMVNEAKNRVEHEVVEDPRQFEFNFGRVPKYSRY